MYTNAVDGNYFTGTSHMNEHVITFFGKNYT